MAQSLTKTGTASWGVTGKCTAINGIVTSISRDEEPILAPEYNEAGQVIRQLKYDNLTTIQATIEVAAGTDLPENEKPITIDGKQGYVKRATLVEDNQAYRKISVTVEFYKECNKIEIM